MSLNFWETVRGNHLADTLIRELPKITDLLKGKEEEKEQFIVSLPRNEVHSFIADQLAMGRRYLDSIDGDNGNVSVIIEKQYNRRKKNGSEKSISKKD